MNLSGTHKKNIVMASLVITGIAFGFPDFLPKFFEGSAFGTFTWLQIGGYANLLGAYWLHRRELPP